MDIWGEEASQDTVFGKLLPKLFQLAGALIAIKSFF